MNRTALLAIGIFVLSFVSGNHAGAPPSLSPGAATHLAAMERIAAPVVDSVQGVVREITAYNVGVPEQTSSTPCIGASGQNLCRLVEQDVKVCAANFVPLGTVLSIEAHGDCLVLDRTHRRFGHRVDIAMRTGEIRKALKFGLQRRIVQARN